MPWKEVKPMHEKLLFIADNVRKVSNFSQLCITYGISRKTGYKWLERFKDDGFEALSERTRKPHGHPDETPYAVQQAICKLRDQRDVPGPKKIRAMLLKQLAENEIPSVTTIYKVLKRAGMIEAKRRTRNRVVTRTGPLKSAHTPNELWSADYKGQFMTLDGKWCYPLTVMDHASRYLLQCQGLPGTRYQETRAAFERLFHEYGLPDRIRTDNGVPFVTMGTANLSRLSIWWMRLGIYHERIEPGQPQQNGRHERMHRTLKRSLGQPLAATLDKQQIELDAFQNYYNDERPHEGLDQRSPSAIYKPSSRAYPRRLPEIEYPTYFDHARVRSSGLIYWRSFTIYVGNLLTGENVGIEATGDGLWDIYFGHVRLGMLDERKTKEKNYLSIKG